MSQKENISRIRAVYHALEELNKDAIFVGGATVSLYAQRPIIDTRPTDDVDVVIELLNYKSYAELEEKLRSKGFTNDVESGVICRYKIHGVTVDVMPTSKDVLGFSNKWYPAAVKNAITVKLDDELDINIFTAPYFIATKLEAFKGRGKSDGRLSTDFEDIVFVLNNRNDIWEEMTATSGELHTYLVAELKQLLNGAYFDEWVSVHLDYSEQKRVRFIIGGITELVGLH